MCFHCGMKYEQHVDDKCLYQPTMYLAARCLMCLRRPNLTEPLVVDDNGRHAQFSICSGECESAFTQQAWTDGKINWVYMERALARWREAHRGP